MRVFLLPLIANNLNKKVLIVADKCDLPQHCLVNAYTLHSAFQTSLVTDIVLLN